MPRNAFGACTLCPGPASWERIEAYLVVETLIERGAPLGFLLEGLLAHFVARPLLAARELLYLAVVRARVAG